MSRVENVGSKGPVELYVYNDIEIHVEPRDIGGTTKYDATFSYEKTESDVELLSTSWLNSSQDAIDEACQVIDILDDSHDKDQALSCLWRVTLTDVLQRDCICVDNLSPEVADMVRVYASDYIRRRRKPQKNPRQSRVQVALRRMAQRYEDFEEFESVYWKDCGRGVYWYVTRNPQFKLSVYQFAQAAGGGLNAYCSPMTALRMADDFPGKDKIYFAELDLSRLRPGIDYEFIVEEIDDIEYSIGVKVTSEAAARQILVQRVVDEAKARRIARYQTGIVPANRSELLQAWMFANDPDEVARMERVEKKRQRRLKREAED